jgi:hypothetical protein
MTVPLHTASVAVFKQMLGGLNDVLNKAATHAAEKKFEPAILLQARLFPDMFSLSRQVQVACDFARSVTARLAGLPVPPNEDKEGSIEELQALIARTLVFLDSVTPGQLTGGEDRSIVLRAGTPKERKLSGQAYLLNYGLPQFMFHVTTAYALLRHNGVELRKGDFMGAY